MATRGPCCLDRGTFRCMYSNVAEHPIQYHPVPPQPSSPPPPPPPPPSSSGYTCSSVATGLCFPTPRYYSYTNTVLIEAHYDAFTVNKRWLIVAVYQRKGVNLRPLPVIAVYTVMVVSVSRPS